MVARPPESETERTGGPCAAALALGNIGVLLLMPSEAKVIANAWFMLLDG